MTWCDKLASTPSIGFKLDWHFASGDSFLESISPILQRQVVGNERGFSVERADPFSATVSCTDGFQYGVDPQKIFVAFQHQLRAKQTSGGPPVVELTSKAKPYSELLSEVSDRLIEATMMFAGNSSRRIQRVGIVTATVATREVLPPGIVKLIQHMAAPWGGPLDQFAFHTTVGLVATDQWSDRGIHNIAQRGEDDDNPDNLINLSFDWQRSYKSSRIIAADSVKEITAEARKGALGYFESLAEGNVSNG